MNKRIKELAKQVYGNCATEQEEKFAELIIKETLQVARAGIVYGDSMEGAVYKYFRVKE